MVIGKAHQPRAVDRNLIRRLIRESFRQNQETLKGLDIIVLLRSKCTTLDKKVLRGNIDKLWPQLQDSCKPA